MSKTLATSFALVLIAASSARAEPVVLFDGTGVDLRDTVSYFRVNPFVVGGTSIAWNGPPNVLTTEWRLDLLPADASRGDLTFTVELDAVGSGNWISGLLFISDGDNVQGVDRWDGENTTEHAGFVRTATSTETADGLSVNPPTVGARMAEGIGQLTDPLSFLLSTADGGSLTSYQEGDFSTGDLPYGGNALDTSKALSLVMAAQGTAFRINSLRVTVEQAGAVIPEPSTYALLGFAGIGLAGYHWRRRKRAA